MDGLSDRPLGLSSTLLMVLVCAIWGGAFVAIKVGLLDMPPLGSAALRFAITSLLLFLLARSQSIPLVYAWPETRAILILAFLFCYANFAVYVGTALTTSGRATVFFYTQPLLLALLAHYYLVGDRLTLRKIYGLILALCGLALLFFDKLHSGHSSTVTGDLIVLSGASATAVQNLIIKRSAGKIHPLALVLWGALVSSLLLGLCSWEFEKNAIFTFSARAVTSLFYLSVISAGFGFVVFAWLIQRHSATRVTALVFLAPVFGVFFGWALLNETLTSIQLLGVAGICLGVYIVNRNHVTQIQAPIAKEVPAKA